MQAGRRVLVRFPALERRVNARLGPLSSLLGPSGLRLSAAGPDEIKASLDLVVASGSVTWKVTRISGRELELRLAGSTGVPASALGSLRDMRIHPALPPGVRISSVHVAPEGAVLVLSRT
ncbi:MAG: hypothetical protein ACRDRJ_00755 [Streptosporangiaceae bacterium]